MSVGSTPQSPVILWTKLRAPPGHDDLVPRPVLVDSLRDLTRRKLTVVAAPTGFGKTTLLAQWLDDEPRRAAWLSLDRSDNDPMRFWLYVAEALETAAPGTSGSVAAALRDLRGTVAEDALPLLLNELALLDEQIVLVLDDYHTITSAACHESLALFVERLPETVRIVISTRSNPPIRLGRLRALGELGELRGRELRFDAAEIGELLSRSSGIELAGEELQLLEERTEGWAAGCYLAALSLRDRPDRNEFLRDFAGSSRHIVDYLGPEVVAAHDPELRTFMLRTSILDRLTGPICDELLERTDSDRLLARLEDENSFLVALDEGSVYRYHRLFVELLRFELAREEAALVPELHRRAARICGAHGDADAALGHALAAGDGPLARELVLTRSLSLVRSGQHESARAMLRRLGAPTVERDPALAIAAGWLEGLRGAPESLVEHWLGAAERAADGDEAVAAEVALVQASLLYGDVGGCIANGERARELADELPDDWLAELLRFAGAAALAHGLSLAGRPDEAAAALREPPADLDSVPTRLAAVGGIAVRSLVEDQLGLLASARASAQEAMAIAEEFDLVHSPPMGVVYTAYGVALERAGELADAEAVLEKAEVARRLPPGNVGHAFSLLQLARVRVARGDGAGARVVLSAARDTIAASTDPGALPALASEFEAVLDNDASEPAPTELSAAELRVLRLLSTRLTQREIARELYLSLNTVKTHVRAIHHKLGVSTRAEAVSAARRITRVNDP